jgi:GNAT superfamily N-acetyltransferase
VSAPEIVLELHGGKLAASHAGELGAAHAEVYRAPPYRHDDEAGFARRLAVQSRQPGFTLAQAWHGGYLVGYAAGMPLRPATSWWRNLTTSLPDEVIAETPGRTFALLDLLVRAPWRRQGIARDLCDLIITGRPEERATVVVLPAASAAQLAFRAWGWTKVARTREPEPGSLVHDVLLIQLPAGGAARH